MKDVQSGVDTRNIPLDRVGVRGFPYPIVVLDQTSEKQRTIADVDLSVSLPAHAKGTHMSRFVEILNRYRGEITLRVRCLPCWKRCGNISEAVRGPSNLSVFLISLKQSRTRQ